MWKARELLGERLARDREEAMKRRWKCQRVWETVWSLLLPIGFPTLGIQALITFFLHRFLW